MQRKNRLFPKSKLLPRSPRKRTPDSLKHFKQNLDTQNWIVFFKNSVILEKSSSTSVISTLLLCLSWSLAFWLSNSQSLFLAPLMTAFTSERKWTAHSGNIIFNWKGCYSDCWWTAVSNTTDHNADWVMLVSTDRYPAARLSGYSSNLQSILPITGHISVQ